MTIPAAPRTRRAARRRRARAAVTSAVALTSATVWVGAATAGETRRPADPVPVQGEPSAHTMAAPAAVVLRREPQVVTAVVGRRGTGAPAWLRRSAGDLPAEAASAYLLAARTVHAVAPRCAVTAPLLAGLGRVVSDHGRLAATGAAAAPAAPDTDGGRLDHDARTDRPVGPMRMLPATWTAAGVDADGDGVRDPRDAEDAALAAAVYLCAAVHTGTPAARIDRALAAWDSTPGFAATVRRLARAYAGERYDAVWAAGQSGPVTPVAGAVSAVGLATEQLSGAEEPARATRARSGHDATRPTATVHQPRPAGSSPAAAGSRDPAVSTTATPSTGPSTTPSTSPSTTPSTTPSTSPSTAPESSPPASPETSPETSPAPSPSDLVGVLERAGEAWTVGGTAVDVSGVDTALLEALLGHEVVARVDQAGVVTALDG